MSLNFRSTAAAFALVLATTTAAQALPLSLEARGGESFLMTAWEWVTSFFLPNGEGAPETSYDKAGGMMDPNGYVVEAGGMMDPGGASFDAGGMMDPNGTR